MNKPTHSFLRLRIKLWGFLTAAGVVLCTTTLLGCFGRFSWFLDLFSHFRVQYLLGLGAVSVLLLVGRCWRTAAVFLGVALLNFAPIVPLYFGGQGSPPEGATVLRAMLINVNTESGDASRVREAIADFDPDILVLEEISSQWVLELAWLTNSHLHSVIEPREDNFGIGLFSKLPLDEGEAVCIGEVGVPSILATASVGYEELRIIATHPLPPGGRDYSHCRNDQLAQLPGHVEGDRPLILLGDLNVTPWNYYFKKLLRETGLVNSAKGYGVQPTWPNFSMLCRIPIDHCLHSPGIITCHREIGPDVGSDHYPVIIDFAISESPAESSQEKLRE